MTNMHKTYSEFLFVNLYSFYLLKYFFIIIIFFIEQCWTQASKPEPLKQDIQKGKDNRKENKLYSIF